MVSFSSSPLSWCSKDNSTQKREIIKQEILKGSADNYSCIFKGNFLAEEILNESEISELEFQKFNKFGVEEERKS